MKQKPQPNNGSSTFCVFANFSFFRRVVKLKFLYLREIIRSSEILLFSCGVRNVEDTLSRGHVCMIDVPIKLA